jgi:hypothetical protein
LLLLLVECWQVCRFAPALAGLLAATLKQHEVVDVDHHDTPYLVATIQQQGACTALHIPAHPTLLYAPCALLVHKLLF